MFYYEIIKVLTNKYDGQPLQLSGYVKVYVDETKTDYLTEIPFTDLGIPQEKLLFSNIPHSTKAEFDQAVNDLVMPYVETEAIQNKLQEVKEARDIGMFMLLGGE